MMRLFVFAIILLIALIQDASSASIFKQVAYENMSMGMPSHRKLSTTAAVSRSTASVSRASARYE